MSALFDNVYAYITGKYPEYKYTLLHDGKNGKDTYYLDKNDDLQACRIKGKVQYLLGAYLKENIRGKLQLHGLVDLDKNPYNPCTALLRTQHLMQKREIVKPLPWFVAIRGPAFSGKSTMAVLINYIMPDSISVLPIAEKLKEIAFQLGWDGRKDAKGRKMLQLLGTEVGRAYNPFCWANMWIPDPWDLCYQRVIVVDDVRYPEELIMIRAVAYMFGSGMAVVETTAPEKVLEKRRKSLDAAPAGKHTSETGGAALTKLLKHPFFDKVRQYKVDTSIAGEDAKVVRQLGELWRM